MSSTAARNAASFDLEGLLKPLIFRTNCSEAALISSSVTGGAKLNRSLMFRHMIRVRDGSLSGAEISHRSFDPRAAILEQSPQDRAVAAGFVGAIAADGKVRMM